MKNIKNWFVKGMALGDNANDYYVSSLLHEATRFGKESIVVRLLAKGDDPNVKNIWGHTPLHLAILHDRRSIAKLLIEHGADVNAFSTWSGTTPLITARNYRRHELYALLVKHGAKLGQVEVEDEAN